MLKLILPLVAVVALALLGACAGATEETDAPAPHTPTVEPTQAPRGGSGGSGGGTPVPITTPFPTSGIEGGRAPDGCLEHELAYADPAGRFAFCYPADMELFTVDTGEGMLAAHVAHPISEVDNRVTVSFGVEVEPYAPCGIDTVDIVMDERLEDFTFAGRTVEACFRDHYDAKQPAVLRRKTIDLMVPSKGVESLIVFVSYSGPDFERLGVPVQDIAMRILDSAVIY